jgi:malate dehydrogenase (quinone)
MRMNKKMSTTGLTGKATTKASTGGCCGFCKPKPAIEEVDVVLVGGGVMSATVGLMLKQLEPTWKVVMYERLGAMAEESSNGWNNAGTGHAALCEPNYTPSKGDSVDVSKAITVNENWQLSRQYWAYLKDQGLIADPQAFINNTPHCTFAYGDDQLDWLQKRYKELKDHPLFEGMEYTDDKEEMKKWCPLMMAGREAKDVVGLTKCDVGTDCDFGALTKEMGKGFMAKGGNLLLFHSVTGLKKEADGRWLINVKKNDLGAKTCQVRSRFVFVGAGGWALLMLQKARIPEIRGFMGFPISGEFLVCQNPAVVAQHPNKVYGKAAIGAPPMSVPHLDKRIIGGKEMILFGPFAGFSPRYLKTGSLLDLIKSVKLHNLIPAAAAGLQNLDLTVYLVKQLLASDNQRFTELKVFVPTAKPDDWLKVTAGQRVQIMKKDPKKIGILQFGTEVVSAQDGTICGLLGASPGASTAVQVALDVLSKCFGKGSANDTFDKWVPKIKEMIPSYGTKLSDNPDLFKQIHASTAASLNIK